MNRPDLSQRFDRSVSLLCWAYNEEESILAFLERASRLLEDCVEDYEIVLVDDGSGDRTFEIASAFAQKNSFLKIVRNDGNKNVGYSMQRAIHEASKEYLFWQTVDWCYDISQLRTYLEFLKHYDIVQGVRRKPVHVKLHFLKPLAALLRLFGLKHLTRRSDTLQKAVVSVINYIMVRTLFRVPVSDFQNVTFYPTKWVSAIPCKARSAFCNPERLIKSYWNGMSIKEVPINFIPRKAGQAKGTRPKAIASAVTEILTFWFEWVVLGRCTRRHGHVVRLNPAEWSDEILNGETR